MKIIISANTSWNIFNFRSGLINKLINRGHEITIVSIKDEYTKKLINIGCNFIEVKFSRTGINPLSEFLIILKIFLIFFKIKPNALLTFTIKPVIYFSLVNLFFKVKIINTITGLGNLFIEKKKILRFIIIIFYKIFNKNYYYFFHNKYDYRYFRKHKIVKNNYRIVPGSGVNTVKNQFNENFIFNKNLRFLFIGRLIDEKGFNLYVESAKYFQNHQNIKFYYVGNYDFKKKCKFNQKDMMALEEKGIIYGIEFTDNIKKIIVESNCIILPSLREGLAHSLLLASALGRPMIVSNVPGLKDIVKNNINGFLFAKGDIEDLINKIKIFINLHENEIKKMSKLSREIAVNNFDEKIVINEYLNILDENK